MDGKTEQTTVTLTHVGDPDLWTVTLDRRGSPRRQDADLARDFRHHRASADLWRQLREHGGIPHIDNPCGIADRIASFADPLDSGDAAKNGFGFVAFGGDLLPRSVFHGTGMGQR